MRFVPRTDLGGYAVAAPGHAGLADIAIERPFVLLCGPNGSGKTALLRMMRAAMGLTGERAGRHRHNQFTGPAEAEDCGGDLGKLAAYVNRGGTACLPDGAAGVLDVAALGWRGERSWLFDSRTETALAAQGQASDTDARYQLMMIASGGRSSSHGQMLRGGWWTALRWAIGVDPACDPYDDPILDGARGELWRAVTGAAPGTGERPAERWLLLDEPETALDAEALTAGLCTLVRQAAFGRLRVFCASHSPIFAAGLADDPNVQVLDLGGERSWFATQRAALALVRDPARVAGMAAQVERNVRAAVEAERKEAERERRRELSAATRGLSKVGRAALVGALAEPDHKLPATGPSGRPLSADTAHALADRKLVRLSGFGFRRAGGKLTEFGVAVAQHLKALQDTRSAAS